MRRLLLAAALALTAGPLAAQAPEVRAVLAASPAEAGGTLLEVRLVSSAGALASFQGELRFPAGTPAVTSGDFAAGVLGAWHEVAPGRIRFAGASAQGVGQGPVLVLRVASAVAAEAVRVELEEAVAVDGYRKLVVARAAPAQSQEEE